ncbi:D-aminoacylase [Micromonospora sp. NPDC006766]|uniref:N-acyl-D-amino-acid deacylase family protein n=1 Tax=Micromonospora sp. NPDC006766 TaxID=3154778 RepID=UPI0034064DD3
MSDYTLFAGGTVVDGTGARPFLGDVLVSADRVVDVRPHGQISPDGKDVVAIDGKVIAPGFVDVHSHSDNAPLYAPGDLPKIRQGVTTEIVGNCGFSLAPADGSPEVTSFLAQCFPRGGPAFRTFADYVEAADEGGYLTNLAALVGEGNLRLLAHGPGSGSLSQEGLATMIGHLREACDAGAFGLSTGLAYLPGMFGTAEQISQLVAAMPAGRVYATHMRNEGSRITDGIEEAVRVSRESGHPVQISHLKVAERSNWGAAGDILAHLDRERRAGTRIGQDAYPYPTSSMMLSSCLPPWVLDGGVDALLERLRDRRTRQRIAVEVLDPTSNPRNAGWDSYIATAGYAGIRVASTASGRYDHSTIAQLAQRLELEPFDALATVILEEDNVANMIASLIDARDLEAILRHDQTMIGTDGAPPGFGKAPHPRVAGTFVKVLGEFVRERGVLTLEEAVRRMSALPAEFFGLPDRGIIAAGKVADLVVFDPETVRDTATYDEPLRPPIGIESVYVGGRSVIEGTTWTGIRNGRRLTPAG